MNGVPDVVVPEITGPPYFDDRDDIAEPLVALWLKLCGTDCSAGCVISAPCGDVGGILLSDYGFMLFKNY